MVDIGYGDLGCFGNPTSNTPAIDTMAAEGAKLVQYYSAASICSPSRGALMTGRTFGRIGIYPGVLSPLSKGGLPLNETTLAERLETVVRKQPQLLHFPCEKTARSRRATRLVCVASGTWERTSSFQ